MISYVCLFINFILSRTQEEQQIQLADDVPVHDGRHDHTAGVRRARPVGRQSADHRQAGAGPVRHCRPEKAVRRRPRQQPRVHQPRRRPLPQEPARRTGGRVQHGVQLVHARLRGADPEHHVQRDSPVRTFRTRNASSLRYNNDNNNSNNLFVAERSTYLVYSFS